MTAGKKKRKRKNYTRDKPLADRTTPEHNTQMRVYFSARPSITLRGVWSFTMYEQDETVHRYAGGQIKIIEDEKTKASIAPRTTGRKLIKKNKSKQ